MQWMQALRFVAAKGHQKAIIVYQDMLQTGKYDSALKSTVWSDDKIKGHDAISALPGTFHAGDMRGNR